MVLKYNPIFLHTCKIKNTFYFLVYKSIWALYEVGIINIKYWEPKIQFTFWLCTSQINATKKPEDWKHHIMLYKFEMNCHNNHWFKVFMNNPISERNSNYQGNILIKLMTRWIDLNRFWAFVLILGFPPL